MEGPPKPTFTIETILGMTSKRVKVQTHHDVTCDVMATSCNVCDARNEAEDVIEVAPRLSQGQTDNEDETYCSNEYDDVTMSQRSSRKDPYSECPGQEVILTKKVISNQNDLQEVDTDNFKGQGHRSGDPISHMTNTSMDTKNYKKINLCLEQEEMKHNFQHISRQQIRDHNKEMMPDHPSHYPSRLMTSPEEVKKRPRTAFSTEQVRTLEGEFQKTKYLSMTRRMEMSRQLGLTEQQIKIWFQNRRTKWKRKYTNDLDLLNQQHYFRFGCIPAFPYPSHVTMVSPEVLRGNPLLVNLNMPQTVLQHGHSGQ